MPRVFSYCAPGRVFAFLRFHWILSILVLNVLGDLMLYAYLNAKPAFVLTDWGLSEFLINYQGGFVRRGLLGELLFRLCEPHHWDPRWLILPLVLGVFVLTVYWFILVFRKYRLCLWFIPTYCFLGMALVRKDFLMMGLIILSLHFYTKIRRPSFRLIVCSLLLIIVLNVHEAAFFIIGPLWMLIMLYDRGLPYRLWSRLSIGLIPVLMFAVLSIFKGNGATAESIFHSWDYLYSGADSFPASIGALAWNSQQTFFSHLFDNFGDISLGFKFGDGGPSYAHYIRNACIPYGGLIVRPLAIAILFYLAVNLLFPRRESREVLRKYVLILLFFFFSLLPLFTVLSCDFQRIAAYWLLSSVVGFHYLRGIELRVPFADRLDRFSERVLQLTRAKKLRHPWMFFLFFSIPLKDCSLIWYFAPIISFPLTLLYVWLISC
ncbi:MAG: hypothetical protein ACI4OS_04350 [Akkermansia sp.]